MHLRSVVANEPYLLHRFQELTNVCAGDFMGDAKFLANSVDYLRFSLTLLQTFENQRACYIEAKYPATLNIQDYCAIHVMCAAHLVGDSVHLIAPLVRSS
jgi:hypothetical protein